MKNFDPAVAHAMNLAVMTGIIKALEKRKLISPWDITEHLSLIRKDENVLDQSVIAGLELAQEWVYKEFSVRADPNGASAQPSAQTDRA